MRRAVRELAVFAFYTVIAVVLTWPLATNLRTAVSDLGDPLLNTWIVDWDHYALTHHPLRLFDASIFYPSKFPLAYSENLLGIALLTLPFYLVGCAPLTIYNIAVIIAFAFSAYGGFVLARMFVGRITPALAAGILYGFVPYKYLHLAHLQILWSAWLPLTLAALLLYRRVPTWCNATLLGGAFLFNGLTNIYYLLFASTALTATLVLFAIAEVRDAKFWLRMATTLLLAGVILLPILWPYHVVSDLYGLRRGEGETLGGSATPISWLVGPTNRFYGNLAADELQRPECALFPGALALFLLCAALLLTPRRSLTRASVIPRTLWWLDALIVLLAALTFVGIVTDQVRIVMFGHLLVKFDRSYFQATLLVMCILIRLAIRLPRGLGEGNLRTAVERSRFSIELWAAALWIGIGFIGSLGLNAFFYRFLFHNVSVFRALRAPARWAMIAYAGLVPWAAAGIAAFRPRRWLGPLFLVLALVDVWPRLRWEHAVVAPSEVDLWIAREHTGALFFLPVDRLDLVYQYEFRATRHHQPIFNGLSGFEPPLHRALRERPLDEKTLALLEQNGCRFVVVRPEWSGWEMISVIAWLRSAIAQGRLAFVRRFEFNIGGDWVFAVTRVEHAWQRFRAPEVPDGAGFSPSQELGRLLAGKVTYSGTTFGRVSHPVAYSEIKGPMDVNGLAMSPFGIRSVTLLIDDGRYRVPLPLYERIDFTRAFPWYPLTPRTAFGTAVPRPRNIWKMTDVQVEIVDGRGKITLLPDIPLTWR